jgi:hypothetical protein
MKGRADALSRLGLFADERALIRAAGARTPVGESLAPRGRLRLPWPVGFGAGRITGHMAAAVTDHNFSCISDSVVIV